MTRHLPYWARIYRLGSEHIFGVYVVTFETWHSAISFDLVQGNMLMSQGKVLSPGNEEFFGCECVCLPLSPTLLYLCSYANFRAFLLGANLVHARHRETIGVLNGSPQSGFGLDCEWGYCCICGIWLLFRVEGGLHFLYFWFLDPRI